MNMQRDEDVETMRLLHYNIAKCDDCQITIGITRHGTSSCIQDTLFCGGQDRSHGYDVVNNQPNEASSSENHPLDSEATDESDQDLKSMEKI